LKRGLGGRASMWLRRQRETRRVTVPDLKGVKPQTM